MKPSRSTPLILAALLLSACNRGTGDAPKESPEGSAEPQNQELLNAVKPSADKARAVEQRLQEADEARRKQIDGE